MIPVGVGARVGGRRGSDPVDEYAIDHEGLGLGGTCRVGRESGPFGLVSMLEDGDPEEDDIPSWGVHVPCRRPQVSVHLSQG